MLTTAKYILLTALRDRLFIALFVSVFLALGVSIFLGSTALVENAQAKNVYIAGSTRAIIIVGLIVFVCFHVRTAFDNKEIELMLSRPISRFTFITSYWVGFLVVAAILVSALLIAFASLLYVPTNGLLIWGTSLFLECAIMIAFALFAALILRSAVSSVLLCFGFYLMSRIMGFFLNIIDQPHLFKDTLGTVIGFLLEVVSAILPRLDLFADSELLIYPIPEDVNMEMFLMQTVIIVPILLIMAYLDFRRKQF